jgi:hypothetical protein
MRNICRRAGCCLAAAALMVLGGWLEWRHHLVAGATVFVLGSLGFVWASGASQWNEPEG